MAHEYFKVGTTQALINAVKARTVGKPDSDALSPMLTAGAALGITGEATDSAAWLQRVSTANGPTTIRSIHGRTLRWNQLVSRPYHDESTTTVQDVSFSVSDGYVTAEGTASASGSWSFVLNKSASIVAGHKMLVSGIDAISGVSLRVYSSDTNTTHISKTTAAPQIFTIGTTSTKLSVYLMLTANQVVSFKGKPQLFDLTQMFGAGFEPSTVAEFEALYPLPYYEYDAGSLLPVNMTGIATEDANGDPLQTRTIDVATYFPDGMRSTGSVYDELTETQAITRIGERAYQSGDESDPTVVTDGTVTHYALATPTTVEIDPPLNLTYRTEQGGTERIMVPTGETSAPPTLVTAHGYTAESLRDAALSCIAPVENGIASTNYGIGSYLVHGGQLCKVTTAIATGESITIGTNVTATTVMAEVIALIAQ